MIGQSRIRVDVLGMSRNHWHFRGADETYSAFLRLCNFLARFRAFREDVRVRVPAVRAAAVDVFVRVLVGVTAGAHFEDAPSDDGAALRHALAESARAFPAGAALGHGSAVPDDLSKIEHGPRPTEDLSAVLAAIAALVPAGAGPAADLVEMVHPLIDAELAVATEDGVEWLVDPLAATPHARARRYALGSFFTDVALIERMVEDAVRGAGIAARLVGDADAVSAALRRVRILDPTVGSGRFLLVALDEMVRAVCAALPGADAARVAVDVANHCLYGADVHPVAVTMTRFAIASHVAARLGHTDFALPGLNWNIVRGDSLTGCLGADSAPGAADALARAPSDRARWAASPEFVRAFAAAERACGRDVIPTGTWDDVFAAGLHWCVAFPDVPGFDIVLGNPPWLRDDGSPPFARIADVAARPGMYPVAIRGRRNLYVYALQRAVALLAPGGALGMLVSLAFLFERSRTELRRWVFATLGDLCVRSYELGEASREVFREVDISFCVVQGVRGAAAGDVRYYSKTPLREWDRAPVLVPRAQIDADPYAHIQIIDTVRDRILATERAAPDAVRWDAILRRMPRVTVARPPRVRARDAEHPHALLPGGALIFPYRVQPGAETWDDTARFRRCVWYCNWPAPEQDAAAASLFVRAMVPGRGESDRPLVAAVSTTPFRGDEMACVFILAPDRPACVPDDEHFYAAVLNSSLVNWAAHTTPMSHYIPAHFFDRLLCPPFADDAPATAPPSDADWDELCDAVDPSGNATVLVLALYREPLRVGSCEIACARPTRTFAAAIAAAARRAAALQCDFRRYKNGPNQMLGHRFHTANRDCAWPTRLAFRAMDIVLHHLVARYYGVAPEDYERCFPVDDAPPAKRARRTSIPTRPRSACEPRR